MTSRNRLPDAYLVTTDGAWSVAWKGSPLCPMGPRERAILCALHYGLAPYTLPIWDGNAGAWRPDGHDLAAEYPPGAVRS